MADGVRGGPRHCGSHHSTESAVRDRRRRNGRSPRRFVHPRRLPGPDHCGQAACVDRLPLRRRQVSLAESARSPEKRRRRGASAGGARRHSSANRPAAPWEVDASDDRTGQTGDAAAASWAGNESGRRSHRRVWLHSADRMRQRREPAARARDVTQPRDRDPPRAWREPRPSGSPTGDRKSVDLARGRPARLRGRGLVVSGTRRARGARVAASLVSAGTHHRREPRFTGPLVRGRADAGNGDAVWTCACIACVEARSARRHEAGLGGRWRPPRRAAAWHARRRAGRAVHGAHDRGGAGAARTVCRLLDRSWIRIPERRVCLA